MNEGSANEPTPLVHNGIIYIPNPDNIVQALDGRTGDLIWETRARPTGQQGGGTGATRNLAHLSGQGFRGHHRRASRRARRTHWKIIWDTLIPTTTKDSAISSGPIVIHGKVIARAERLRRYKSHENEQGCFISAYEPKPASFSGSSTLWLAKGAGR